ncbi:MAG: hypothetical protein MZV64_49235 [Ignavibacteriales bacterium]|nr:hypothetical protein [Ignavibacteriales bacterium]
MRLIAANVVVFFLSSVAPGLPQQSALVPAEILHQLLDPRHVHVPAWRRIPYLSSTCSGCSFLRSAAGDGDGWPRLPPPVLHQRARVVRCCRASLPTRPSSVAAGAAAAASSLRLPASGRTRRSPSGGSSRWKSGSPRAGDRHDRNVRLGRLQRRLWQHGALGAHLGGFVGGFLRLPLAAPWKPESA